MPPPSSLPADPVLASILDGAQAGILILDSERCAVMANRSAGRIIGKQPASEIPGAACHQLLFRSENPCEDCPLPSLPETGSVQRSSILRDQNGEDVCVKRYYSRWGDLIIITLQDVTREVTSLRQLDLVRKELQAKQVLLERQRNESAREGRNLRRLLDLLPEAIVWVNATYDIRESNRAATLFGRSNNPRYCYELLGLEAPCSPCPASKEFKGQPGGAKKSHRLGDRYFTETIVPSEAGYRILVFRDTTRQIELIEQIRNQQDKITRHNGILSGLVELSAKMQQRADLEQVLDTFLDLLLNLLEETAAVILVQDIRVGNLWTAKYRGLVDQEIKSLIRLFLSREVQQAPKEPFPSELLPWQQSTAINLLGGDGKRVGLLVLLDEYPQTEKQEVISLFAEPMGAFLHNQQLMRQLEERANTDPLTGVFNRGFMERALRQEVEKHRKYAIPFAVVMADINGLKMANDLYGHEAGDRLLLKVSGLLKGAVRSTDIVARAGGDEFIIILPNTDAAGALAVRTQLETRVFKEVTLPVGENETFPVTVSLGATATDQHSPEDVIKGADALMYQAKEEFYRNNKRYR